MIILACNDINKSFGIDLILENITFSINEGDKIGLVGINGTGKTTLFKIISGEYGYDSGEIYLSKNTEIGYLEQNTNFESTNNILEEVLTVFTDLMDMEKHLRKLEEDIAKESNKGESEKLTRLMDEYAHKLEDFGNRNGYGYKSEAKGVLKGLGFSDEDFTKTVNFLSGGEKTRVLLAKLLLKKPNLLLLDEPTNHLDTDAVEWLEFFLKQYNGTVLLISHDRYFLDQVSNRIFELHNKKLKDYNGNYSTFIEKAKVEKEIELKKYEQQQIEIKRQEEVIEKLKAFGREKQVKRARSREKALDKIEVMDKPESHRKKARIRFEPSVASGYDVLQVNDLAMGYDERILFRGIDFNIYKGEKVALIGPNGIGKSTLFKILMNELNPLEGRIKLGANVNVGYFHQEQKTLNLENTIINEIWNEYTKLDQTTIRSLLGAFLFEGEEVFKEISTLSGGERARVALLKLMLSKSNFLLLDEPTNHLDIDSKEILEDALSHYDGTLFIISHDRYFLNKVVDKILVLNEEGLKEYLGNYDYYLEKRKQQEEEANEEIVEEKTKTQLKEEKRKEREKREREKKLRREREKLEKEIMEVEEEIEKCDHLLCEEKVYSDPEKSKEINQNKMELEEKLAALYEKWEEML